MFPKKELAQLVISACQHYKIDTVVISPGSRNAPLTIGFSNHPDFKTLSVVDERCAAFFGLGIAQQTLKPVALLCTSGSALLNYYPAIAEAYYSKIPLIIISADRPKHLIDIGDGQTIRQENVFKNHILFEANLKDDSSVKLQNMQLISEALHVVHSMRGPVHINVPFDEPLYETTTSLKTFNFPKINSKEEAVETNYQTLAQLWNASDKKMILIGVQDANKTLQSLIQDFAKDKSVLILTETTSNIHHENVVNAIDQLIFSLDDTEFEAFKPDVLITFGGMLISKRIKQFLRKYPPKHHWDIDAHHPVDTFFCLSAFIKNPPIVALKKLIQAIQLDSTSLNKEQADYQSKWLSYRNLKRIKHQQYLNQIPHSDFKVFEQVLNSIPDHRNVQISNSAVIRYTQLFEINPTLQLFCNRGTSGIDGSTSTALGAAFASPKQTVFITGDLSFFYDSNALWNTYIPSNFRIILINNSGGGIFKIIPGPKTTNALNYFETPHCLTAVHLSKMYHFDYESVSDTMSLQKTLDTFFEMSDTPKILEVFTPSQLNDTILNEYFNYIK